MFNLSVLSRRIVGFVAVFGACMVLQAQRLPDNAAPSHYHLKLTPDLKAATFAGEETITLTLKQPSNAITLNAAEIKFGQITAKGGSQTQTGTVALDEPKQQATITFPQKLPAGAVVLTVKYTGILNDQLRGFYLSKTEKRRYAVTQFESTDARRAFPCFDEPAFKATFGVTLVVDRGDVAISNMNVTSDVNEGSKHVVSFATTPKMSTYLVAFLVGDFQCISGESDGTPIRACSTPEQVQYTKFAVATAEYALHYYNTYFGIKYPLPKMDMIGIPDFEAGAMENFGAITYRESALLLDEKTASEESRKRVAEVVTHEMAHQWFGDLVTMQWWDNLWLNEGFATWMEHKPLAKWKPEWHIEEDDARELDDVLNSDSQATTRTIRAKAETPAQIDEMFDGIAYGKAGAVLGMVEHYAGEESFRTGIHNYLAAHLYSNATAEDFWTAEAKATGKPIDQIMNSFVSNLGTPLLQFTKGGNGTVQIEQSRFFVSRAPKDNIHQSWIVPVCEVPDSEHHCEIVGESKNSIKAGNGPVFFANATDKGYYRSQYSPELYRPIVSQAEAALSPEERLGLLGDTWALVRSGKTEVAGYLDLAEAVKGDPSSNVIRLVSARLHEASDKIASDEDRRRLSAWVVEQWKPIYSNTAHETDKDRRVQLFSMLGGIGDDSGTVQEATGIAKKWLSDQSSVEPDLANVASQVAATHGDKSLYDQVLELNKKATDPQVRSKCLRLLASFRHKELVQRTLDYAASNQVRNQDAVFVFAAEIINRDTREQAWAYIQANWDQVKRQLTPLNGRNLVQATGRFCDTAHADQVRQFFASHPVTAAERTLSKALDDISDCSDLRQRQEPSLHDWLTARVH